MHLYHLEVILSSVPKYLSDDNNKYVKVRDKASVELVQNTLTLSHSHILTYSQATTLTLTHAQVRDKATGELVQNLTSAAPRFLVSRIHIDASDQIKKCVETALPSQYLWLFWLSLTDTESETSRRV